jgi:hypothetical protein
MERDVHAKDNQEGRADKAGISQGLEKPTESLPRKDQKFTHNLGYDQGLNRVKWNESWETDSEMGCTTHHAIHRSRNVKFNKVKNQGHKKGRARKRVDLPRRKVSPKLNAEITPREKNACRNRPISSSGRNGALE